MTTLIYKQLNLKIYDNPEVNQIMKQQRGTLYIYINLECQKSEIIDLLNYNDFEGDYTLKFSSFNEEVPKIVTKEQCSDLMDFLLNSQFDEEQAFNNLSEDIEYEFNYLDKYTIPYHLKNDVVKVEALLKLVANVIINNGADTKSLDNDGVNELVELMREAINIHEGNTDDISKAEFKKLEAALENGETIEFKYNGLFYEIFESVSNEGYIVNVYSSAEKIDGEYLEDNLVDGGLCSGGAENAILFML